MGEAKRKTLTAPAAGGWQEIDTHTKDVPPFLLGTISGGIMAELWHWCPSQHDFVGLHSRISASLLRRGPRP